MHRSIKYYELRHRSEYSESDLYTCLFIVELRKLSMISIHYVDLKLMM